MQLPQAISSAIAATKTAYFEPQYLQLRDRLINAVMHFVDVLYKARRANAHHR